MFEYLMPLARDAAAYPAACSMPDEPRSRGAAQNPTAPAAPTVPWGISESGYNATSISSLNYQYRAFGVPGLGLKRGLGQDLVIAPYATALALMVEPDGGLRQPAALAASSACCGRYGLLRGDRLHPVAPAATDEAVRGGALVHGPSPGHESAVAGVLCCATSRCSSASVPTRNVPGHPAAAAGAYCPSTGRYFIRISGPNLTAGVADAERIARSKLPLRVFGQSHTRVRPGVQSAVQRPLPRAW